MAGFTGGIGAGESLNAAPLDADTSQQAFLTTPRICCFGAIILT
jgi:hypothetical protein